MNRLETARGHSKWKLSGCTSERFRHVVSVESPQVPAEDANIPWPSQIGVYRGRRSFIKQLALLCRLMSHSVSSHPVVSKPGSQAALFRWAITAIAAR